MKKVFLSLIAFSNFLIAQEIQKVIPDAVTTAPFDTDENGNSKTGEEYLTVQYERLIPILVQAIKEQQLKVKELLQKIEDRSE